MNKKNWEKFFSNAFVICFAVTSFALTIDEYMFSSFALVVTMAAFFGYLYTQMSFCRASVSTTVVSLAGLGVLYLLRNKALPPDMLAYEQIGLIICLCLAGSSTVISWLYNGRHIQCWLLGLSVLFGLLFIGAFMGIPFLANQWGFFMALTFAFVAGVIVWWLYLLMEAVIIEISGKVKESGGRKKAYKIFRAFAVFCTIAAVFTFSAGGYMLCPTFEGKLLTDLMKWFTCGAIVSSVVMVEVKIRVSQTSILWMGMIWAAIFGLQLLVLYGLNWRKPMAPEMYLAFGGIMRCCIFISGIITLIGLFVRTNEQDSFHWALCYWTAIFSVACLEFWLADRYWYHMCNDRGPMGLICATIAFGLTSFLAWILARRLDKNKAG